MSFWTAIVLIVMISAIAGVMRSRGGFRHSGDHDMGVSDRPANSNREQELQREVIDLRERIKVLERIATDANSAETRETRAIAEEIERLRDK